MIPEYGWARPWECFCWVHSLEAVNPTGFGERLEGAEVVVEIVSQQDEPFWFEA